MITKVSKQISKFSTIILNGNIQEVFPLFSPKGEEKWVSGWQPEYIYPDTGDFVENMVFKTKSSYKSEQTYNWTLTYLNTELSRAVYTVNTPNRVWAIKVQCTMLEKFKTVAVVTYTYTALNNIGEKLNRDALEKMFRLELKDWEEAINHYLKTGEKLLKKI
jgi:hypothetical protein